MERWGPGYTQDEIDQAQARYDLRFPPDLVDVFRERRLIGGYDWTTEDRRIREMLDWPFEMLWFDVAVNRLWWPAWGRRPDEDEACAAIVRDAVQAAPRLIPLYGRRFIPEAPNRSGNPVFSMHGFDTIYYGASLDNYFAREFGRGLSAPLGPIVNRIPFWSDLAERFDNAGS